LIALIDGENENPGYYSQEKYAESFDSNGKLLLKEAAKEEKEDK
jgi:hypothetical protein